MRHFIRATACARRLTAITLVAIFFTHFLGLADARGDLPMVRSQTTADFAVGAVHPDLVWPKNLADPTKRDQLVFWGTWMGHPTYGTLELGPFKAPAHFSLMVAGMPFDNGNLLKLIRLSDKAELIVTRHTPGNRWEQVNIDLPIGWVDRNIKYQAIACQQTPDSWFALSEPFNLTSNGTAVPLWANRTTVLRWRYWGMGYMLPILAIFLFYSMIGISGYTAVRPYLQTPAYLAPILIAAVVGLCGYVVFWGFFINASFGAAIAWAITALACVHLVYRFYQNGWRFIPTADIDESKWPVLILIVSSLFYLGLLNLPRVESTPMEVLAARRPTSWALPSDNVLQENLGYILYQNLSPQLIDAAMPPWQSSDRPPLECGVQLLSAPLIHGVLKASWNVNGQLGGMVLQLIWVYAVWAVVRALGFSTRASGQIVLCLVATPFLYINSIFVWSKLSAATYALGATLILCFRGERTLSVRETVLAGVLIALGVLSHSGIVFYLVPIVAFWMIFPSKAGRPGWQKAFILGTAAMVVFLPWTLYQKLYDPPGNHLLKMHLAGEMTNPTQTGFDNQRSTVQAIRSAYHAVTWKTIWDNRIANFQELFKGDWTTLFLPLSPDIAQSRLDYFLYTFRSCGVYIVGLPMLLVLPVLRRVIKLKPYVYLFMVISCSAILWCLIMFSPGSTVVHQGAYANQLLLMILLVCLLRLIHPVVLAAACVYNLIQFLWVYADCFPYPAVTDKLSIAIMIIAILVAALIWMFGGDNVSQELNYGKNRNFGREDLRGSRTSISTASA